MPTERRVRVNQGRGPRDRAMHRAALAAGLALAPVLVTATPAAAQALDIRPGVEERVNLHQRQQGVRVGSFVVRPKATLLLAYDDNVFATKNDPSGDGLANAEARVTVNSDFRVHDVSLDAFVRRRQFASIETENLTEYGAALGGRYDISRDTNVTAGVRYEHLGERRGSIDSLFGAVRPAQYSVLQGDLGVTQRFNRVEIAASGRVRKLQYDTALIGGARVDQGARDFTVTNGALTASYALAGGTAFQVRGEVEHRRYDRRLGDPGFDPTQVDRSADGLRIEAGVSRQIGELVSGTVRVGYLRYTYPDGRVPTISGLSYSADLRWDVTPLTTLTARAIRRLDETVSPLSNGNLRDEFAVGVQHELLRDLLLTADATYANINSSGALFDSREFQAELGARWYASRSTIVQGALLHRQRNSASPLLDFQIDRVTVGISFVQ